MRDDLERVFLTEEQIAKKISQLAARIEKDYEGKTPLFIGILKGSVMFFADLIRKINMPIEIDFMAISSYGTGANSSGEVKMVKDVNYPVEGKHVILVEDIIDSGLTLNYLTKLFAARGAKSIKIASLLDKKVGRKTVLEADYVGFEIPNHFVVGYGLDYAERYRNLPDICILKKEIYTS